MSIDPETLPSAPPVLKVLAAPQDVNTYGDIFGGWLMSQVDIAGAIVAVERARGRVATVAVNGFQFLQPVKVGDLVMCFAEVKRVGTTSIGVHVEVFVERRHPPFYDAIHLAVARADLVYVCFDEAGNTRPVPSA